MIFAGFLHWSALQGSSIKRAASVKRIWIDVPAGYVTDLASVPRALWTVFPPHGRYAKAAIVHDYLYSNAIGSKRWADKVFLEAMGVLDVPKWRKWVMYFAVRLFGRGNYGEKK